VSVVGKGWEDMPTDSEAIDLGNGTKYTRVVWGDNNEWVGINEWHLTPAGELCGGWIPFAGTSYPAGQPTWDVISRAPLTLSPSLLCRSCQHHGFIREGRWVPA